jgi:hypothetical protein
LGTISSLHGCGCCGCACAVNEKEKTEHTLEEKKKGLCSSAWERVGRDFIHMIMKKKNGQGANEFRRLVFNDIINNHNTNLIRPHVVFFFCFSLCIFPLPHLIVFLFALCTNHLPTHPSLPHSPFFEDVPKPFDSHNTDESWKTAEKSIFCHDTRRSFVVRRANTKWTDMQTERYLLHETFFCAV